MKTQRDIRRANLELLVQQAGGQKALADRLGKDKNQVYQWGLAADQPASRNISDRTARAIEQAIGLPTGWMDNEHEPYSQMGAPAASQSGGLDPAKLEASINFLEQQFGLWGREFIAADQTLLIAGVYERLTGADSPAKLIELSQWLADQVSGGKHERQGETGSTGRDDRSRDQRRAAKA